MYMYLLKLEIIDYPLSSFVAFDSCLCGGVVKSFKSELMKLIVMRRDIQNTTKVQKTIYGVPQISSTLL